METELYSLDAEEAVVSSLIVNPDCLDGELLDDGDLYDGRLKLIFAAITKLHRQGVVPDIVTIQEMLSRDGVLDDAGGVSYLLELLSKVGSTMNAPDYARIIRDYSERRLGIRVATLIAKAATDVSSKFQPMKFIPELQALKYRDDQEGVREAIDIASDLAAKIDGGFVFIPTGIPGLDKALEGGLFGDSLYIGSGRPSAGKTALFFQIAQNIALKKNVLFFSLEMSGEEVFARRACGLLGISMNDIRSGKATQEQKNKVKELAMKLAHDLPGLTIIDKPCNIYDIARMIDQRNPDFVLIDHLNEIKTHKKDEKYNWFGEVCKILRDKAKEKHIPICLLHQLSRVAEADRPPMLSDLKWSGEIEERSDVVMMLHRPDRLSSTPTAWIQSELDVYIRKYRNGPQNVMVPLKYDLVKQWFTDKPRL